MRNQYRPTVVQIKENLYHAITYFNFFGIQDIKMNYVTPVPEWPILLNVTPNLL